jgi:type I restriction enzyme, S subunit
MTANIATLVADNLDIWTSATIRKSGAGRGGGKRISLYGIERLRALILDLAVRGKLVPQDAGDEDAGELLKRIKSAKSNLVASGKAKSGKPLSVPAGWPFDVPTNWVWSQLGEVTNYGQTDKADPGSVPPETWVLELEDVEKGTSRLLERVLCSEREFQSQKNMFQIGDVIYGKLRPYLDKVIIADQAGICTTEMVPMRGYGEIGSDYIRLFLKTPFFISLATKAAHGMNLPRLATAKAREAPFPLPPLAEQRRIAAKVDELMAHCDALERESAGAMAAHTHLVEELLGHLVDSANPADLATNWARLETYFDILFTTDASIEALKQTILDLAVRGKLVEQDAGDEAANVLLKKVRATREILVRDRKIKTIAENSLGMQSNQLFDLPATWVWAPLGNLVSLLGDGIHGTPNYDSNGEYFFINGNNLIDGKIVIKNDTKRVDASEYRKHKKELGEKTVFVSINGTIGNVAFFRDEMVILGKSACYFNLIQGLSKEFFMKIIKSRHFLKYAHAQATGSTIKNVSLKTMRELPIPLAPVAEQHRIVAKVDALMAHCYQLKTRLADAAQTQRHLADAVTQRAAA